MSSSTCDTASPMSTKSASTVSEAWYLFKALHRAYHAPCLARALTSPIFQICFYACHYMAFFFNPKKRVWMTFDDASVTVH